MRRSSAKGKAAMAVASLLVAQNRPFSGLRPELGGVQAVLGRPCTHLAC